MDLLQHGEERRKPTKINDKTSSIKCEKYCVKHGWIDLFPIGGVAGWQKSHAVCPSRPRHGAEAELPMVKRQAA